MALATIGVALVAAAATVWPAAAHAGVPGGGPYPPDDPGTVLQRLPRADAALTAEVAALRDALTADPDNPALAAQLADAYLSVARQTGDVRYHGYAQSALARWWGTAEPPTAVLAPRAAILQQRHAFDAARADLEMLVARQPRNAQGWLSLANLERVTGQLDAADAACRPVLALAGAMIGGVCLADVGAMRSEAPAALATLTRLLEAPSAAPSILRWAQTVRAEVAWRLGEHAIAAESLKQALTLAEREDVHDAYLLGLWADFELARGNAETVRQRLRDHGGEDALLLRRAIAERRAGEDTEALIGELGARIEASRRRGDTFHRREEARFALDLADAPGDAVWLARQNWSQQREPADALLLARAAVAANDPEAARPVAAFMDRWGTQDVRVRALLAQLGYGERAP